MTNMVNCAFKQQFQAGSQMHFWQWLFTTVTGFTGVLLTLLTLAMMAFVHSGVRRRHYSLFKLTHALYIPLYIATIVHGAAQLIQAPDFWKFFLGPALLFVGEKATEWAGLRRHAMRVSAAYTTRSGAIHLRLERPRDFEFKAGQYLEIAVPRLGATAYHPFTIVSPPHERVALHIAIRVVGPWTRALFNAIRAAELTAGKKQSQDNAAGRGEATAAAVLPVVMYKGAYGSPAQSWEDFEAVVMVGASIGITPFLATAKAALYRIRQQRQMQTTGYALVVDGGECV